MTSYRFSLGGETLVAMPDGVVIWPAEGLLVAGDLHLGRAERTAREGGDLLPPYETDDTLDRLEAAITRESPSRVVLLGDSFDDMAAMTDVADRITERLARLAAGRQWIWISGNHDPGPVDLPGSYRDTLRIGALTFCHVADRGTQGPEISGHYHPKATLARRGQRVTRRCHLTDGRRLILSAFGTYTGGLRATDPVFDHLVADDAIAILLGRQAQPVMRQRLAER